MALRRIKKKTDRKDTKDAKRAPHGDQSCSIQPADKCPNRGNCMTKGCKLHGRTGR